ncbi:MAG: universal stress protein, partial [Pseudomonadota bacterium]
MSVTVMLGGTADQIVPAIETAIESAKRLKTSLTGLCALPDPSLSAVYIAGAETVYLGTEAVASLREAQDKLATELKQVFTNKTEAAGTWLRAEFKRQVGSVGSHGAAAASLADAFVLPPVSTESNHPLNPVFEHVLMEANLPLVVASPKPRSSDTCLIAWDGSPLAARAVRMHMPLIKSYESVIIAQNPKKIRHRWAQVCTPSAERLTELLREERLKVSQVVIDGPVSEGIISAAESHEASLIVMGAYGHNRLGQMLFGGTTSKIL